MTDRILEVAGLQFRCLVIEIAITISSRTSINGYGTRLLYWISKIAVDYWITRLAPQRHKCSSRTQIGYNLDSPLLSCIYAISFASLLNRSRPVCQHSRPKPSPHRIIKHLVPKVQLRYSVIDQKHSIHKILLLMFLMSCWKAKMVYILPWNGSRFVISIYNH